MKNVLIFISGIGCGSLVTWYFVKKHYEKIADREIADVVNKFKSYKKEINKTQNPKRDNIISMERPVSRDSEEELFNGLIDTPRGEESVDTPHEEEPTLPYVISDEDFGEDEDYEQKTLFWYYRDNILATDEDLEVENVKTTVGDALEEFKKDRYTERVLVKNDQDETYYEILISEKHFYEVTGGDIE